MLKGLALVGFRPIARGYSLRRNDPHAHRRRGSRVSDPSQGVIACDQTTHGTHSESQSGFQTHRKGL